MPYTDSATLKPPTEIVWYAERPRARKGYRIPRTDGISSLPPITNVASSARWLAIEVSKIHLMRQLSPDWSSHESKPPNAVARDNAVEVLKVLAELDLRPTHVDPSVEEGVCLSFRSGHKYADIECFNSGEVLAIISDESSEDVWDVMERGFKSAVVRINQFVAG